jgi:predicted DNA binding CopG/RHH family protein
MKKINFKKLRLTKEEREIERDIEKGLYVPVSPEKFREISEALAYHVAQRKKDAVLNIRINRGVLENLKMKAKKHGIPYQTFISEILQHHAA